MKDFLLKMFLYTQTKLDHEQACWRISYTNMYTYAFFTHAMISLYLTYCINHKSMEHQIQFLLK